MRGAPHTLRVDKSPVGLDDLDWLRPRVVDLDVVPAHGQAMCDRCCSKTAAACHVSPNSPARAPAPRCTRGLAKEIEREKRERLLLIFEGGRTGSDSAQHQT